MVTSEIDMACPRCPDGRMHFGPLPLPRRHSALRYAAITCLALGLVCQVAVAVWAGDSLTSWLGVIPPALMLGVSFFLMRLPPNVVWQCAKCGYVRRPNVTVPSVLGIEIWRRSNRANGGAILQKDNRES